MSAPKCGRCGKFACVLRRLRTTDWQVMTGNVNYGCKRCSPELFEDVHGKAPNQ